MKRYLLIALFLLLLVLGSIFVLYHHYRDYDITPILSHTTLLHALPHIAPSSPLTSIHHVFVIVKENHDWRQIYQNPDAAYVNKILLAQGAFAKEYYNVAKGSTALHPSEPNYMMLEAGMIAFSDHTFTNDDPPSATNSTNSLLHLTSLLEKKGYSWKAYQEDISGDTCPINSVGNYAPKHDPFVYFQNVSGNPPREKNTYCIQHIRPLSELQKDIQTGHLANYIFITPNLQHDMHDGTIAQGDTWLSQHIPLITQSDTFKKDGALFITWDEGTDGNDGNDENNPIGMIITSPFVKKGYSNSLSYSHASLIKTIEEIFQLTPLIGLSSAGDTLDLSDLFQ